MKRQLNLASVLGIAVLTFVLTGCEEPGITGPDLQAPKNSQILANAQPNLIGTWIRQPANVNSGRERTLTFSRTVTGGLGTLFYPDRTGRCGGQPELRKQFEWSDANGPGTLTLTVTAHTECGVAQYKTGQEEAVSYSLEGNTLRIFSYSWVRKR